MSGTVRSVSRRVFTAGALIGATAPGLALAAQPGGRRAAIRRLMAENSVAALIVLRDGRPVVSEGQVARPLFLHSMRKSILSALYGVAVGRGEIDLTTKIGDIGIDDDARLTEVEKSATIRDLLLSRSGVYIPASAEAPTMKARRPARGSHAPGTFWYYNNWDFNVLGNIYERLTSKGIFTALEHDLARPLGMQDFDPFEHGVYQYETDAPRYPAYHMIMSARDLARFGQMYLDGGRWKGHQVVPEAWVAESTRLVSRTNYDNALSGYGYLWWGAMEGELLGPQSIPAGSYTAAGAGGHFVTVLPALRMVTVTRVDTFDDKIKSALAKPNTYSAYLKALLDETARRA